MNNNKAFKNRKKLLLDFISCKEYQPMRAKDIAMLLELPKGRRHELFQILDELVAEEKIICDKGKYRKLRKKNTEKCKKEALLEGTFMATSRGFGFVAVEGEEEDYYIAPEDTLNAFHMDKVAVSVKPESKGKRKEGIVKQILGHTLQEVVGTFQKSQNFGFVVPDNEKIQSDIFIPKEHVNQAADGDKVVAKITAYGDSRKSPVGKIIEILGGKGQPGVDILSIARGYELPMDFPERVVNQAARIPDHILEGDFQGRMDLRDWTVVTIDGEDAKDLDDAISLTLEGDIYHLGVHIADVTNYVQENSALDREALRRGTSVYLADRVIPMLPKKLSNGICSLNQGEDRLALSCLMDIDRNGKVISHEIAETVICVDRRMSYTQVQAVLDEDEENCREFDELVPLFLRMRDLSSILRKNRSDRGSIDFDVPESKIILDELGRPIEIRQYERNTATDIIEDFMLMANETVAKEFSDRDIPFVYRTHARPDSEKIEKALTIIRNQGVKVIKEREEISPLEIRNILEQVAGEPCEPLISRLLLRSMQQARYTTGCSGHFGLAAKHYCHFTSPIRRYPDLQIHRIIKDTLRGRMNEEKRLHYLHILEDVSTKSSMLERRAEEVERETIKLKKAEYMTEHIGEVYTGVISGVTGWGLYVELPNTVEGLIHVNTMWEDYYNFDEETYSLIGEESGHVYRLGQPISVQVASVDMGSRAVDFVRKE